MNLKGPFATHGHTVQGAASPTFKSWDAMVQRCRNPKATGYQYYGGRGIAVCGRWLNFVHFLEDMGARPAGASLDRIDGTRGYQPDNCRWASRRVQGNNTSRNRTLTFRGVTKTMAEWARALGVPYNTFSNRIYRGWSLTKALKEWKE